MQLKEQEKQRLRAKYGPWAVVTGASSGMGMEMAEQLASAGIDLVISGRNRVQMEDMASVLYYCHGVEVRVVAGDLSEKAGIEAVKEAARGLNIGLFVAAAGQGSSGDFLNASLDRELEMLQVNCEAMMVLTYHFAGILRAKKRGGIVLMSSLAGFQGIPGAAHFSATKAYVKALAEGLSVELADHGVDVLEVANGPVFSGFAKRAGIQYDRAATVSEVGVSILQALGRRNRVFPGTLSKWYGTVLRLLPRSARVWLLGKLMQDYTYIPEERVIPLRGPVPFRVVGH